MPGYHMRDLGALSSLNMWYSTASEGAVQGIPRIIMIVAPFPTRVHTRAHTHTRTHTHAHTHTHTHANTDTDTDTDP